jgi:hypothetical protein
VPSRDTCSLAHALTPNSGTTYNFVITSPQPLTTTNLTAKIVVSRVILEHHQITNANANANAVVTIDSSAK